MKRKVITLEVETDASNKELKEYYRKGKDFFILGEEYKIFIVTQVQVNNIEVKGKK